MLANIRAHSFMVARVAEAIVTNLLLPEDMVPPHPDLVRAGALLHDIAKTECLDGSCRHAERGQEICEKNGYPEIGVIVGEHVYLSTFAPDEYARGCFSACELVYYADKRVKHDRVVGLEERLAYIIDRYSDGSDHINQRIRENFNVCIELEDYLFSFLPFRPDELADKVKNAPYVPETA
ncbi:MAG: metal-dependent phosphohydrolase [Desulfobacterales bacterium]|nr:MAG: metal-dependent phosphohydrolase [Desulfobacterales bacterium]